MDTNARIEELRRLLKYHSDRYYNQDDPEISDYDYDQLMQELRRLEAASGAPVPEDSPTRKIGGSAKREAGVLVQHRNVMLSLQDVFSREEVDAFVADTLSRFPEAEFVVETKIDGLSMSLRYENGELQLAETRGDGIHFGEDVTQNARVIPDVVQKLKEPAPYVELRGEVYMTQADFEKVNEQQELLGKRTFANPRNCAAGTLRQLDSAVVRERGLSMFVFNIQETQGISFKTHTEGYAWLKKNGVKVIEEYIVCRTADEVWQAIGKIGESRGELRYDIDGAVVKINQFDIRAAMGATSKVPRWAVAYKYPPERKETRVLNIELSVGRTGKIVPTAEFEPIRLCGTTVSRATLHNQDFIDKYHICIGSTIVIEKSGEVIPKCVGEIAEKRPEGAQPFRIPPVCPVCGAPAVRQPDTADIRCTNANCPAQLEKHIINFVARDAMDIRGFGEVYIQELVRQGYIGDIADIFTLAGHRDELIEKGIIGKEKNTDKLLEQIEKAKNAELRRLITGFGIANIGKAGARSLAAHFGSVDAIMAADEEQLTEVPDVGGISAKAIHDYFADETNRAIVEKLRAAGVRMTAAPSETAAADGPLAGLTFVITGTLPDLSREEAAELIRGAGGKVSGSVSKKTDYLLSGEAAGSKLTKAQSLGVPVIDLDALRAMLEKSGGQSPEEN